MKYDSNILNFQRSITLNKKTIDNFITYLSSFFRCHYSLFSPFTAPSLSSIIFSINSKQYNR